MKLQEILTQLGTAEFSQLSIGGQPAGEFNELNYPAIVGHINLGLTTLYRRFLLKEGHITVALQPGRTVYPITSTHAVQNKRSKETARYLEDTAEAPFQDDIHKILRVLSVFGREMPLNQLGNDLSCMTPTLTTLSVPDLIVNVNPSLTPYWLRTDKVTVVYQANHPQITIPLGYLDPTRVNIELPHSHLEALLYFVASRVNNPIGMSNEFHAGNSYAAKFEQACRDLEAAGIEVEQQGVNTRLRQKGFP